MRKSSYSTRTCRDCGASFQGRGSSVRCPPCQQRRRSEVIEATLDRRYAGTTRKLGSTGYCEMCGAPYVVRTGKQRVCPACRPLYVNDRARQRYRDNSAHNPSRQVRSSGSFNPDTHVYERRRRDGSVYYIARRYKDGKQVQLGSFATRDEAVAARRAAYAAQLPRGLSDMPGVLSKAPMIDLSGQHIGNLQVHECTDRRDGTSVIWRCTCDCGSEVYVSTRHLLHAGTVSCGCHRRSVAKHNLAGEIHDKLGLRYGTNLSRMHSNKKQRNNTSGYRGVSKVSYDTANGTVTRWRALLYFQRRRYECGTYDTPEEAYEAYLAKRKSLLDTLPDSSIHKEDTP